MAQSSWDREGGRGEGGPWTLRKLPLQWAEKAGLEKQVLEQFIDVLVKEAIVVTLRPRQHRTEEEKRRSLPGENNFH